MDRFPWMDHLHPRKGPGRVSSIGGSGSKGTGNQRQSPLDDHIQSSLFRSQLYHRHARIGGRNGFRIQRSTVLDNLDRLAPPDLAHLLERSFRAADGRSLSQSIGDRLHATVGDGTFLVLPAELEGEDGEVGAPGRVREDVVGHTVNLGLREDRHATEESEHPV